MDALVRAGSDGQRFGNEFKSKPESDSLLGGLGLGLGTILKNDKGAFMKVRERYGEKRREKELERHVHLSYLHI